MSLLVRKLEAIFNIGTGDFGDGKPESVKVNQGTFDGLKISAQVINIGAPGLATATIRIWGLTLSVMNKVARTGKPLTLARDNTVTLLAGDDVSGMSQVFSGIIWSAYIDFNDAPSVSLNISGIASALYLAKPAPALSFPSGGTVATMMAQIAATMGKNFQNFGVTTSLPASYFPGSPVDQARACAQHANINYDLSGGAGGDVVMIWPKGGSKGGEIPLISAATGLVGYPKFCDQGVIVTSLYAPGIAYGSLFKLETVETPASGQWYAYAITLDLESETPGGKWFMDIEAHLLSDASQ